MNLENFGVKALAIHLASMVTPKDISNYHRILKDNEGYLKNELARFAAALSVPTQRPAQWADISTAPKDKTLILIYCPDPNEQDGVGYVDDRGRTYCVNNGDYIDGGYGWDYEVHATHWMPLPATPQTDKAGE